LAAGKPLTPNLRSNRDPPQTRRFEMKTTASIAKALAVTAVTAGVAASSALAAGEPKNMPPFTRALTVERALAQPAYVTTARLISGELKNEMPFTRLVTTRVHARTASSSATVPLRGEPKNQVPFTTPA
jgi:hypothetical protein